MTSEVSQVAYPNIDYVGWVQYVSAFCLTLTGRPLKDLAADYRALAADYAAGLIPSDAARRVLAAAGVKSDY